MRQWLFLCCFVCAVSSTSWKITTPTVSDSVSGVWTYKNVVLLCGGSGMKVTNENFKTFDKVHLKNGEFSCSIVSGPAGFLRHETNYKTNKAKLTISTNGKQWQSVTIPLSNPSQIFSSGGTYYAVELKQHRIPVYPYVKFSAQVASSPDLNDWLTGAIQPLGLAYPQIHVNSTAVVVQTHYTPNNISWVSSGWAYSTRTHAWTVLYNETKVRSFSPLVPDLLMPAAGGWFATNFSDQDFVEHLIWTKDFKNWDKHILPVPIENKMNKHGGPSGGCAFADGSIAIKGGEGIIARSSQPLNQKSWSLVTLPNFGYNSQQWVFHCAGPTAFISDEYGAMGYSHIKQIEKWTPIYNGVVGKAVAVVTDGNTIYVPTQNANTWVSGDSGRKWKPLPSHQGISSVHSLGKGKGWLCSNRTHILQTENFSKWTISKLPYHQSSERNSEGGAVGVTTFKNNIVMLWFNSSAMSQPFALIATTPIPLTTSSVWTTRFVKQNFKFYQDGLTSLAGDDSTGFVAASGQGAFVISTDGLHWTPKPLLKQFDQTEGLAAGGGKVVSIFRTYNKKDEEQFAAFQINKSGTATQLFVFPAGSHPSYSCEPNCMYWISGINKFMFTYNNGSIGVSSDFKNVSTLGVTRHPTFERAMVATTSSVTVALYYDGFSQGKIFVADYVP